MLVCCLLCFYVEVQRLFLTVDVFCCRVFGDKMFKSVQVFRVIGWGKVNGWIVELQHLRCGMIQHLGPHLQTSQRKTISWTLGVNLSCEQIATTATCPAFGVQSEAKAGVVATTNLQPSLYASLSLSNLLCTVYVNTIYTHNQSEESNQEPEPPHFGMRSTKVWCDLAWTSHCRLSPFGVYSRRRSGNMLSWIWKAVLYICFTLKQHGECKRLRMIWCVIKSW